MNLLFAAAEIFPFAKSGGLADIAYALPKVLGKNLDSSALMPLYAFVDKERFGIRPTGEHFMLTFGKTTYDVELFFAEYHGLKILFVYNELLCDREYLYGPPGEGYEDNDLRFAIFSHAIVEIVKRYRFDLLHLNDWHTALAALLVHDARLRVKIVYTIHNLAYQGMFPPDSLVRCGIDSRHFSMEELEFYGQVNWMKAGIAHADAVTTVSPGYAIEIQKPEFGFGLDGFLRRHREKLTGILNGIDTEFYDPENDPVLPAHFGQNSMKGKSLCKKRYLEEIDMDKYEWPLFIFIGRLIEQKGIDLIVEAVGELARKPLILAILGEGEERFHAALETAADGYANIHLRFGYDESLSHRMYAAADFLLMPSRFEPCGLNQMIAMRYGTVPVVHRVGGLRDSVHPIVRGRSMCGLGITIEAMHSDALVEAVDRALDLYDARERVNRVMKFDMGCDFSIEKCARKYLDLYKELL
jgi:starch synthase